MIKRLREKLLLRQSRRAVDETLERLVNSVDMDLRWSANPQDFKRIHATGFLSIDKWEKFMESIRQRRVIQRLRKKKWLSDRRQGNHIMLKLNNDAMAEIIKERIRRCQKMMSWPMCCFVIFDVPVAAKMTAQLWRRFLRSAGFHRHQLSVWTSQKDVFEDMAMLLLITGFAKWAKLYLAVEARNPKLHRKKLS